MKKYILKVLNLVAIPNLIGVILFITFSNAILWQISLFVFAMLIFVAWMSKYNREDKKNMRKYGSTRVDKFTPEYITFKNSQKVLFFSAIINVVMSYIIFIIFGG